MLHFIRQESRYTKNLQLVSIPSRVYTFVLIGLLWEVFILIFWKVRVSIVLSYEEFMCPILYLAALKPHVLTEATIISLSSS